MAEIEYDLEKSFMTLRERGFDFDYAARIFLGRTVEVNSPRNNEDRILAIGIVDGKFYTVIYTLRNGARRIISARRSRKDEIHAYREKIA